MQSRPGRHPTDSNFESLVARAEQARSLYFPGSRLGGLFQFDADRGTIQMPREDPLPDARFGLSPEISERWAVTMGVQATGGVYSDEHAEAIIARRQSARTDDRRHRKGRVLHLRRNRGNAHVVASIAFHLPTSDSAPIDIMAIGLARHDDVSDAETIVGAWTLKQYLHALAPLTVPADAPPRTTRLLHCVDHAHHTDSLGTFLRGIGFLRTRTGHAPRGTVPYRQESG